MKKWILFPILLAASVFVVLPTTGTVSAESENATCITLYEHIHYEGRHITLCEDAESLSKWDFNDKASSVKVSNSGKGATLYQHVNFHGKWLNLEPGKDIPDFTKIKGLNDDISSVNIKN